MCILYSNKLLTFHVIGWSSIMGLDFKHSNNECSHAPAYPEQTIQQWNNKVYHTKYTYVNALLRTGLICNCELYCIHAGIHKPTLKWDLNWPDFHLKKKKITILIDVLKMTRNSNYSITTGSTVCCSTTRTQENATVLHYFEYFT